MITNWWPNMGGHLIGGHLKGVQLYFAVAVTTALLLYKYQVALNDTYRILFLNMFVRTQ